jgi:hypothetical protein
MNHFCSSRVQECRDRYLLATVVGRGQVVDHKFTETSFLG